MADVVTSTNLTAADAPLWNTEAHHGPVVSVVTWFFIVAVVLAVAARTVTRFAITRKLRWDDKIVLLASVSDGEAHILSIYRSDSTDGCELQIFAIGQCIAVSAVSTSGLGSHADTLALDKIDSIEKVPSSFFLHTLSLLSLATC